MTYPTKTTWNPADKLAALTLSSGDLVITPSGTPSGQARSRSKASSGKWYVELTRATSPNWMFGLSRSTESLSNYPGRTNLSIGIYQGSVYVNAAAVATVAGLNTTGVFGMAVDADARTVRFFNAGFTTAAISIPFSGDIYLAGGGDAISSGSLTLNSGGSAFTYSVPSGYTSGYVEDQSYGIAGVVTDAAGAHAARTVRAYRRDTGALVGSTVSNGSTGAYLLLPFPNTNDAHTVVALPSSSSENAIVYDWVVPT